MHPSLIATLCMFFCPNKLTQIFCYEVESQMQMFTESDLMVTHHNSAVTQTVCTLFLNAVRLCAQAQSGGSPNHTHQKVSHYILTEERVFFQD